MSNIGVIYCVLQIQNEILIFLDVAPFMQAYNLSKDHKPELEVERERILKAGGFIHAGRVNGSLNLARAIGTILPVVIWFPFTHQQSKNLSP